MVVPDIFVEVFFISSTPSSPYSYLVLSSSPALFMVLIDFLVKELKKNSSMSTTRTYIQCLGAITRQAGHRVGEHLEIVIPLIVQFCNEDDDELREYCIQVRLCFGLVIVYCDPP